LVVVTGLVYSISLADGSTAIRVLVPGRRPLQDCIHRPPRGTRAAPAADQGVVRVLRTDDEPRELHRRRPV